MKHRTVAEFTGDTYFPDFDKDEWDIEKQSVEYYDEKSGLKYIFYVYIRKISNSKLYIH